MLPCATMCHHVYQQVLCMLQVLYGVPVSEHSVWGPCGNTASFAKHGIQHSIGRAGQSVAAHGRLKCMHDISYDLPDYMTSHVCSLYSSSFRVDIAIDIVSALNCL